MNWIIQIMFKTEKKKEYQKYLRSTKTIEELLEYKNFIR